jgi:hypothetical protein
MILNVMYNIYGDTEHKPVGKLFRVLTIALISSKEFCSIFSTKPEFVNV